MTGKPADLMRQLVRICEAGGCILDPFAGAGTTLVAAQLEDYRWVGCKATRHYRGTAKD